METEKRNVVIVGGGIIGCSSAYFLTRHPKYDPAKHSITLLEASAIASNASGKAGGLLALWAYPSNIVPLSFKLHAELAKEHNGAERWGYRRLHCGQLAAKGRASPNATKTEKGNGTSVLLHKKEKHATPSSSLPKTLDWISPYTSPTYEEFGNPDNTAQVHPYQFTTSMAALAQEKGVKVIHGLVTSIQTSSDDRVESISYTDNSSQEPNVIPATDVILSAGPWTQSILPGAPISALRAHSVTIRPSSPVSAYALFTEISLPAAFGQTSESSHAVKSKRTQLVTPEIYARPGNEVYACGEGDTLVPLPQTAGEVETDPRRCQDIVDYVGSISDELRDGEVTARQACYLPNVEAGAGSRGPLIGKTKVGGLVLATGHTCWGIQNGPGTGKLVAELVFDGEATSANVKSLSPALCGL